MLLCSNFYGNASASLNVLDSIRAKEAHRREPVGRVEAHSKRPNVVGIKSCRKSATVPHSVSVAASRRSVFL